ncbi:MAG: Gfo/Idh/MocA family oxidoreductase [Treponema sp.]|jgi:predicted dehydrogenase|nr:Gfo/Idh/MocA family oxidoreductase [Treponema sp.]
MNKINAAIIGLGRIASLLEEDSLREKPCTHAGAITSNEDCVLAAGCDIEEERRLLFAERWKRQEPVPVYRDAEEMLLIHKPQILCIATHPDSHYRYCKLAALNKVPVIICEKPLADNIRDARKIVNLEKKYGTIIITNHERRYSLDYIRAKAILDEKRLGNILSVHSCLYMGKTARLLDQLWHDGTHLADAVMFLCGAKLKHRWRWGAKLSSHSGTTWLEGSLYREKEPPVPLVMEIGAGRDHLVFEIEFSCEKGRLCIGNGIFEVWGSVPSPYAEKFRSLKKTDDVFSGPTGYFANMLKDAVSCVRDPQRKPVSGATDGLNVIEYLNSVMPW